MALRSESESLFPLRCYALPSPRFFPPRFRSDQLQTQNRQYFQSRMNVWSSRNSSVNGFANNRLGQAASNAKEFNEVLKEIMGPVLNWGIVQAGNGELAFRPDLADPTYDSDGLGRGNVNLLFVVDALYDSLPGELILIDEPELSLHPVYQRRLALLLAEYAKDRQIVLATHSPYFVDIQQVLNGAEIARVHKVGDTCSISQLSRPVADELEGLLGDSHNPHVFGLNAREAFFLEDGVIVLEGQEDVVYYPKLLDQLVTSGLLSSENALMMEERFFGWGAGGADKIDVVLAVLHDLGFAEVVAILDKNKECLLPHLQNKYKSYFFGSIPADDVRTKKDRKTVGLLDQNDTIRPECEASAAKLFNDISSYLQGLVLDSV